MPSGDFWHRLDADPNWMLTIVIVACTAMLALLLTLVYVPACRPILSLLGLLLRLVCCKGRRTAGRLTGVQFPIKRSDLAGPKGPHLMAAMLRHGGHLAADGRVTAVREVGGDVKDGVKGDKAIIEVEYGDTKVSLPRQFFIKFNIQRLQQLPMRLLMETSECCRCEAAFYHVLAKQMSQAISTPRCYFVDHNDAGEFVLLTERIDFGENGILPLKHRIRDMNMVEEIRCLIVAGAKLNAQFWGEKPELADLPRFDQTHKQFWTLVQLIGRIGLRHTVQKTLKGSKVNESFMTWQVPVGLQGKESQLIADLPSILSSLCDDIDMMAFGHNDMVTDNAFFCRDDAGKLELGLFDWQQSCVNNVGQEWAWNWHFLEPDFLDKHETSFIDLLLETYSAEGIHVSRAAFTRAYVLGCVQMFVFGGGGLQMLLSKLHRNGLFESLVPNDPRCRDETLDKDTQEQIVGAEMTRRTFTNCCRIMQRHNFVGMWEVWRQDSLRKK